jgi:hypothetical protein
MEGADQCVKYVVKRFAPQEILDRVPCTSEPAVMPISASSQTPQSLPGRPICQSSPTWTPEEEETLLRLHRKRRDDWNIVLAALPGRTKAAARVRWHFLQQEKIEREENDGVPQPQGDFAFPEVAHGRELVMPLIEFPNTQFQAQPAELESIHLPLPREPEMPFAGLPNHSPQSRPDIPATETEFAASIALEQGVMPATGFPNARFEAQQLRAMSQRTQEAAVGSTHANSSWTPEEDSALIRLHSRTITAAKQRWKRLNQNKIEDCEDKTAPPQRQGDFEFQKVARPREPMTPFVGFPNPSLQSQPGAEATEPEVTASIALE